MSTKTNIRRIMICVSLALMLTTSWMIKDTHAGSADYTIRVCERTAWGVNYIESRKKTCELIWLKMNYDILKSFE